MDNVINIRKSRILVVDDDPDSIDIVAEALRWEGYEVQGIDSGDKAVEFIKEWEPHVVLLDNNMPGLNGIATLRKIRQEIEHYVAVIFLTGNSSTEDVINGLDAGADDYVIKPFDPLELLARVRAQLRIKELTDQLRAANEKLQELVDIDDLTGLFNMRSIFQRLDYELDKGRRYKRSVCVIMMDMDNFKGVNDGHDHLFGSFVLSEVGQIIKQNIRSVDLAARYGGDEFLIVLTEINNEGAHKFCQRLKNSIEKKTFSTGKDSIKLTASLGYAITAAGQGDITPKELVRKADRALYGAKESGRNCIKFFDLTETTLQVEPHMLKKLKA